MEYRMDTVTRGEYKQVGDGVYLTDYGEGTNESGT